MQSSQNIDNDLKQRKKGLIERAKDKAHAVNDNVNQKLWGEKNASPTCVSVGNKNLQERENRVQNLKKKYDSNNGKPPIAKHESARNLKQEKAKKIEKQPL